MATAGERLDRLEQWRGGIDNRLWGGGNVAYERSIEGRLAAMEHTMQSANALAEAAKQLQRATGKKWSLWQGRVIALAAAITAACALVSAAYLIFS